MFKLIFSKTYDNYNFIKYNIKPVVEDYFCVNNNVFCIADGVTRDSINGENIIYPTTLEEIENWIKIYPNPSGAYEAAQIIAENFVDYLIKEKDITEKTLFNIVKKVNNKVWKINEDREINYIENDLYCAVATGGIILENYLICFSIGDCHIKVLNERYEQIFETENNHSNFEKYEKEVLTKYNFDWTNPKDRILVRAAFRNNPIIKDKAFGVLSGEKAAMEFVKIYKVDLKEAKYICAYSDGCEPNFEDVSKIKSTITNPQAIQNSGKEKTLIVYERIN